MGEIGPRFSLLGPQNQMNTSFKIMPIIGNNINYKPHHSMMSIRIYHSTCCLSNGENKFDCLLMVKFCLKGERQWIREIVGSGFRDI